MFAITDFDTWFSKRKVSNYCHRYLRKKFQFFLVATVLFHKCLQAHNCKGYIKIYQLGKPHCA